MVVPIHFRLLRRQMHPSHDLVHKGATTEYARICQQCEAIATCVEQYTPAWWLFVLHVLWYEPLALEFDPDVEVAARMREAVAVRFSLAHRRAVNKKAATKPPEDSDHRFAVIARQFCSSLAPLKNASKSGGSFVSSFIF